MIATKDVHAKEKLSPLQMETFKQFKTKLAQNIPKYHISSGYVRQEKI
jgi:hypothetical protein